MLTPVVVNDNHESQQSSFGIWDLPLGGLVERFSYSYSTRFENKRVIGDDISAYTKGFIDTNSDLTGLMQKIQFGQALCPSLLAGSNRKKDNYAGGQLVVLDIDNAVPKLDEVGKPVKGEKEYSQQLTLPEAQQHPFIQKHACLIYTTPSHTAEWHKFRIVFILPNQLTPKNRQLHEQMVQLLLEIIPGDKACSDASRIFYGNTNAEWVLINPSASLPPEFIDLALAKMNERNAQFQQKRDKASRFNKPRLDAYQMPGTTDFTQAVLIAEALKYIHPDDPYEDWILVGMALHSAEDILPNAQEIWGDWARTGATYDHRTSRGSIAYRWKGFDQANHNVSLGSLFWLAEQKGFTKQMRRQLWSSCQRRVKAQVEKSIGAYRSLYQEQLEPVLLSLPEQLVLTPPIKSLPSDFRQKTQPVVTGSNLCIFRRYLDPTRERWVNEWVFRLTDEYSIVQHRWESALPDGSGRHFADRKISYLYQPPSTDTPTNPSIPEVLDGQQDGNVQVLDASTWGSTVGAYLPPYRAKQVLTYASITKANTVLLVEGVHIAEAIWRCLGIPAIGLPSTHKHLIQTTADALRLSGLTGIYLASRKGSKAHVSFSNRTDWIQLEFIRNGAYVSALNITAEDLFKKFNYLELETNMEKGDLTPDSDEPMGYPYGHPLEGVNTPDDLINYIYTSGDRKLFEAKQRLTASLAAAGNKSKHNPGVDTRKPADHAKAIADRVGHQIAWHSTDKNWWVYLSDGYWSRIEDEALFARQVTADYFEQEQIIPTKRLLTEVEWLLRIYCVHSSFDTNPDLLSFKNGVLNHKTGEFRQHQSSDYLTWQLPYDYEPLAGRSRRDLIRDCQPIWDWLHKTVGGDLEDVQIVHLLMAYLAAIVRGVTQFQRFLVCYGPPGSGKGTYLRLAEALVGSRNTASTSLEMLESGRFNKEKLTAAKLTLIPEMSAFVKAPLTLKALTGGDTVELEQKGKQQTLGQDRAAKGLFLMAGEMPLTTGDTGGINRRQISVPFSYVPDVTDKTDLISFAPNGQVNGTFAPYLPSLFQLVMSYTEAEIRQLVLETDLYVPRLSSPKVQSLLANSKLLAWVEDCLYYSNELEPESGLYALKSQVGRATDSHELAYSRLYPSYKKWREQNGLDKASVSLNKFRETLSAEMSTLGLPIQTSTQNGKTIIRGLAVRPSKAASSSDDGRPIYESYPSPESPRVVSQLYLKTLRDKHPIQTPWNTLDGYPIPLKHMYYEEFQTGSRRDTHDTFDTLFTSLDSHIEEEGMLRRSIVVRDNSEEVTKVPKNPEYPIGSQFGACEPEESSNSLEVETRETCEEVSLSLVKGVSTSDREESEESNAGFQESVSQGPSGCSAKTIHPSPSQPATQIRGHGGVIPKNNPGLDSVQSRLEQSQQELDLKESDETDQSDDNFSRKC